MGTLQLWTSLAFESMARLEVSTSVMWACAGTLLRLLQGAPAAFARLEAAERHCTWQLLMDGLRRHSDQPRVVSAAFAALHELLGLPGMLESLKEGGTADDAAAVLAACRDKLSKMEADSEAAAGAAAAAARCRALVTRLPV